MRGKSDLWCSTNIAGMHAWLEGSQTGELCLSCWRLCLELSNCSCTVSPLPWDSLWPFCLWQTPECPMFPSVQMLQHGSLKHGDLGGWWSVAPLECSKSANVKLHKARAVSGDPNLVQVCLLSCTIHAHINPPSFLLVISNLHSHDQVDLFQKETADSLWEKASELIRCYTNTEGSGPKTTLES